MKQRILIFAHNYVTQFLDICNQYTRIYDKDQYHVTVAYLTGVPDDEIRERTLADEVLFLNFSNKDIRGLKIEPIKKMLALCREKQFTTVICHRYKPTYIMLWVAQFCKIPKLFFVMHEMGTLSSLNRRALIACLARKNMIFAGVSNAVRDDMRKDIWCVPEERVITLYNCIDIELTQPQFLSRHDARKELNLPDDVFVFGTLGRLEPAKDQKTLIEAYSIIQPRCENSRLILLGDGKLRKELEQLAKKRNIAEHVIFYGFIPGGYRLLKALDIFVLPSIKEAFGRVLIEAMVAQVPVIGARTNGIPEVIGDAGMMVEPGKPDLLAEAMLWTYHLTPEQIETWQENMLQHVKDNFSIEAFKQQFFK